MRNSGREREDGGWTWSQRAVTVGRVWLYRTGDSVSPAHVDLVVRHRPPSTSAVSQR